MTLRKGLTFPSRHSPKMIYLITMVKGDRAWIKKWRGRDKPRAFPRAEVEKRLQPSA